MAKWGSAYFLEEKVDIQTMWSLILQGFKDFLPIGFPEKVPENFFFKRDDFVFSWDNSDDSDLVLTDLDFSIKIDGKEDEFTLVYEKNSTLPMFKQKIRRLIVREEYKGDGLPLCCSIMPLLKSRVPKLFVLDRIRDEKWRIYKAYPGIREQQKKKKEAETTVQIDFDKIAKMDFSSDQKNMRPEFLSKYDSLEALRSSYVKPKEEAEEVLDEKEAKQKAFDENFFLIKGITFYADIHDQFWFDESWIRRFCSEMWFLNAHYNQYVGARTYVKNMFLAMNPLYVKWNAKRHKSKESVDAVNKCIEDGLEKVFETDPNMWRDEAHILVMISDKEVILTKSNTKYATYEEFRDSIVGVIEFDEDTFYNHVNTRFAGQDLVRDDEEVPIAVKQKVNEFLSEHKLDAPTVSKLRKDLETIKAENEELKKAAAEAKKQHEDEISELEQKLRNAALPAATLAQSNDAYEKDIADLKQSLKEREAENKQLKDRIAQLEQSLFSRVSESEDDAITLRVPASVKPLFKDELSDYLFAMLYGALEKDLESLPHNRADEVNRKRDVLQDILERREFKTENCETMQKIERISTLLKSDAKSPLDLLLSEGIVKVEGAKNHPKYYFYDEKYQMTVAGTPSDIAVAWRQLSNLEKCFFLLQ